MLRPVSNAGDPSIRFEPIVDLELGRTFGYLVVPTGAAHHRASMVTAQAARDAAFARGRLVEQERRWRREAVDTLARSGDEATFLLIDVDPRVLDAPRHMPGSTRRLLAEVGLPLDRVVVRVSAASCKEGRSRALALARHYTAQGFAIALRGVDAGGESADLIDELNPRLIDLESSLSRGMPGDLLRRNVVRAFVEYCEQTQRILIVDGVDSLAALVGAVRSGVRYARGFVLGRPAPRMVCVTDATRGLLAGMSKDPSAIFSAPRLPSDTVSSSRSA
jgi:EAL domain-containing protein (putative c-di-GMP-specific phosphodiesterase class I)